MRIADREAPLHTAPISLFGKLPIAADFLRRRCFGGAGAAFRDWLSSVEASTDGVRVGWRLLHVAEGYPEIVVAQVVPSVDATGTRRFPLALYTSVPRAVLGADAAEVLHRAVSVWREIGEACCAVRSASLASLDDALDGHCVRIDSLQSVLQEPVSLRAVARSPEGGGLEGDLACRLWRLRTVLSDLANRRYRGPHIPVLALPLASEFCFESQAMVWLKVLQPYGVGGREHAALNVAMPHPCDGETCRRALELRLLSRPLLVRDGAEWLTTDPVESRPATRVSHEGFRRFAAELDRLLAGDAPLESVKELLA